MFSRVYIQLSINHEEVILTNQEPDNNLMTNQVMAMLQDYRDNPCIGDQVDYLMHACQVITQSVCVYTTLTTFH